MKKIYFAGKFTLEKDDNLSLSEKLVNDFRSIILCDSKKLTYATDNLKLNNKYIYSGPFYCEQASNGNYTSTDCNVVLDAEYKSVSDCDVYFAMFDENFSVGTIVELGWALNLDKDIIIYYKEEDSKYRIKSDYWFAIADAIKRSNKIKIYGYCDKKEAIRKIKEDVLGYEI